MSGSLKNLALVKVIRPDAGSDEPFVEFLEDFGRVIDALEQDALVSEGNAGINDPGAGGKGQVGQFPGMIEMGVDPQRLSARKAATQLLGEAHR